MSSGAPPPSQQQAGRKQQGEVCTSLCHYIATTSYLIIYECATIDWEVCSIQRKGNKGLILIIVLGLITDPFCYFNIWGFQTHPQ